ncbi:MAG: DEAD/DEAH box helicase, partial [Myxococcota bacterium]
MRGHGGVVVEAEPGAGKTTRVPAALLDVVAGAVVVLEPRRLAARLAATRVAAERGTALGDEVGYQVRFDNRTGPDTRLRFVTEGILLRQLTGDPELSGVGALVLDEIHER